MGECEMRNAKCKIKNDITNTMKQTKPLFIPCTEKRKGSTAYYEFQYCKRDQTEEQAVKSDAWTYWAEDSLLVHMDGERNRGK